MRVRERGMGDEALLGSVEGEGEDEDEGEVGTRWGQGQDEGWQNAHNCAHRVIPRRCRCHVVIRVGALLSSCRR
jgi:hypothetical protein